ncbi:MAG: hypothetical protein QOG71_2246 [Pyrinomonadaceae bacterium]|nr:hypothetical protein [Pyrinomonadaceae bacterium]
METTQDLFISHASSDKEQYVLPLAHALTTHGVSFWLDSYEIGWGDNVVMKINEGLRTSRYALICLSENFMRRRWPESEMSGIVAIQNNTGQKRVLPLILNSKDEVLASYPILSALAYREFSVGVETLAAELASLVKKEDRAEGLLQVVIESVHTEQLCNLKVSPRVSVAWLARKAQAGVGVKDAANIGAFEQLRIKWVLIDASAMAEWDALSHTEKLRSYAVVKSKDGVKFSYSNSDRLEELGVYDGIVFNLAGFPDLRFDRGGLMFCIERPSHVTSSQIADLIKKIEEERAKETNKSKKKKRTKPDDFSEGDK